MKEKVLKATVWSFLSRIGAVLFEFFFQIILARILLPEDFGLIASLALLVAFGNNLSQFGLGHALIQNKNNTFLQECSIFYLNILLGVSIALITYFISKPISNFYNNIELESVVKIYSLYFVFNSFTIIQDAILTKQLKFKLKLYVNLFSVITGGIFGIILALLGYGYWSLVAMLILKSLLRAISLWFFSDWKPSLIFSLNSIKEMTKFGLRMVVSSFSISIRVNLFSIVLGKFYTMSDLGYFSRANQLQNITSKTITTSIQNVLFPVFSKIKDDEKKLNKAYRKSLINITFIVTPLMGYLFYCSNEIIEILLTDKWIKSAYYLKFLSFIGLLYPIQMMNFNVIKSLGLSKLFLRSSILLDGLSIIAVLSTISFGIELMIVGQIIAIIIALLINVQVASNYHNYKLSSQLSDIFNVFLICFIVIIFLEIIGNNLIQLNDLYLNFLLKTLLFTSIFVFSNYLFNKKMFINFLDNLKSIKNR